MTDARYFEIRQMIADAYNADHASGDIAAMLDAGPAHRALAVKLGTEMAEYLSFDRSKLNRGLPFEVKDRILERYPHLAPLYLYDRQFAVNACRLAAVPTLDAIDYLHLAAVAAGRYWTGDPADYDAAQ